MNNAWNRRLGLPLNKHWVFVASERYAATWNTFGEWTNESHWVLVETPDPIPEIRLPTCPTDDMDDDLPF